MRKTRSIAFVICTVIALLCSGCEVLGPQTYQCEINDVKTVQIIRLDRYVEGEYRYEYTVLCDITDKDVFVERLNAVEHSVNWGDPRQMDVGYIVIKIDYVNGDFDLLHSDGQCFNRSGTNQYGYFFFDETQFEQLIAEYADN
jgi:hypothetical protein